MKTSNKILLGIFIGIIVLTLTVQLMVYAKYKRGDYTAFQRESFDPLTKITLPAVRYVSIIGLGNCVIKNSDSIKLEVQDYKNSLVLYSVKNDTLIIKADYKKDDGPGEKFPRTHKLVNVYVPAAVPIRAAYSYLFLTGSADTLNLPSYTVHLVKSSSLHVTGQSPEKKPRNFNLLNITGEYSYIDLDDDALVNDLRLQLVHSTIDDKKASIQNMTIEADAQSSLNLSGNNIKALK